MSDEATSPGGRPVPVRSHSADLSPPCLGCGLRNPIQRRSCLACGAPLGSNDEPSGPLPVDLPMLERDEEAQILTDVVAQLRTARTGGIVAIAGERGLGTTRLLRHVAEQLIKSPSVRMLTTTVRESDGPYPPMTRLLWERFLITPAKGPITARAEIASEVGRVLSTSPGTASEHVRRIVIAAGLPGDSPTRWELDPARAIGRVADSIAKFVRNDAAKQPIALLVDNYDGAADEGLALFSDIARQIAGAPVLIVVAGLPAIATQWNDVPVRVVTPRPLSTSASTALCRSLLPGIPHVPDDFVDAVVRRSEGVPGRIREILLALVESRVIIADDIPWRLDLDALVADGPISSLDMLGFRVAKLDREAAAVIARAAVVGEVFWEGAVVAMTRVEDGGGDPFGEDTVHPRVSEALRRLVAAELVAPIEESQVAFEREYSFELPGLREAVLRGQDAATRRARHDACASWLELAAGPRADDLSRAIASHLERAGLTDAAARGFLRAARAARASYRGPQAVQLFDKALALLPSGDAPARIDALHDRGVVLSLLGRVDEASASFVEMLNFAHRYGARNKMAAALGRLGRLARGRGDLTYAKSLLWRALELFQQADDPRGVAAVQDDLGVLAYLAGDFETALGHSSRALEIRRNLDDPLGEALSTHNLGLVHFARGQPRQARAQFERALALREKHGDIEGTAATRNVLAALAWERGEAEQAERSWNEILELAEALGDKRMIVVATHNLGEAAIFRGDVTRASQRFDAAEVIANEIGDRRALAEIERTRGTLARVAGDNERASMHLERSVTMARELGLREAEAVAMRGLAEVSVAKGDALQAERHFSQAIQILDELGAIRELARARALLGRLMADRGDVLNARMVLTLAVPVLERLELAEAKEARAALMAAGGELGVPGKQA